jgi:hypothetical protein
MSRQELAEAVNAYIYATAQRVTTLDSSYVGKLERGGTGGRVLTIGQGSVPSWARTLTLIWVFTSSSRARTTQLTWHLRRAHGDYVPWNRRPRTA